jgi:hypothetical protein
MVLTAGGLKTTGGRGDGGSERSSLLAFIYGAAQAARARGKYFPCALLAGGEHGPSAGPADPLRFPAGAPPRDACMSPSPWADQATPPANPGNSSCAREEMESNTCAGRGARVA